MCAREVDESFDMRRRSSGVPAHHLEHGEVEMPIDGSADVTDSGRARYHLLGDFTRPINLANAGSAARSKEVNRLGRAPACTWAGAHRLQHGGDKARLGVSSHAANSSNNAFASFRSRVSKPSVNHP